MMVMMVMRWMRMMMIITLCSEDKKKITNIFEQNIHQFLASFSEFTRYEAGPGTRFPAWDPLQPAWSSYSEREREREREREEKYC